MNYILTLIAARTEKPLLGGHIEKVRDLVPGAGQGAWLEEGKAADIPVSDNPGKAVMARLREELFDANIDIFVSKAKTRRKKLLIADMDSTIVGEETLDELAGFAGIKDKIAAITARAMNGELDFEAAVKERVGLLKDLPESALAKALEQTTINAGAKTLVATMKKHGARCVLVSGGFTFFTGAIAKSVGFDAHHGNTLIIKDGALTGAIGMPILDKHSKVDFLEKYAGDLGLQKDEVMSIGDGANDLPMLKIAGLGVGYKPKPSVAAEIDNVLLHGDLSAPLYAQGYISNHSTNI